MLKRFFISMLGSLAAIWISIMLCIVLAMTFAITSVIGAITSSSPTVKVSKNSVLCINLDSEIADKATTPNIYDIINEKPSVTTLGDIVNAIQVAADDNNIAGIYIKCEGASAGLSTRQTIREALADFHEQSNKWVIAYGDTYTQGDYYIASVADEVYLNPIGSVNVIGLASGIPFYKNLLDKLGIDMQIVKVGTFKSAVEPFILTSMSEANRLQTESYLNAMWGEITSAISSSRNIPVDAINQFADSLNVLSPATDLVEWQFVDGLKYTDEITDLLKERCDIDKDDKLKLVSVKQYLASGVVTPNSINQKNKIAIYYAEGDITEDGREGIASKRVVPDILDLADDDDINALVLRVNSGGGSAFASEQIWHALEVFKSKGKTFYVSMGDVAASGGYYISCGAEKIFAQPTTITGSIGIFGMIPCAKDLLNDKIGINIDYVTTNANSAGITTFEPMTAFQRKKLQGEINRGYELFTLRCAEGRHMQQDSIKAIAEGRVWDGLTAKKIGLVDELGSLDDAIKALADEMNYKKYQVVTYPDTKRNFFKMLSELELDMKTGLMKEKMGPLYPAVDFITNFKQQDRLQARTETIIIF